MLNKLKQIRFTKKGIYISLAICMLLVGGIGVFSAIRNMNKIVKETDFVFEENADAPDVSFFEEMLNKPVSEPVISEEVPVILNFVMPVENGQVSKPYSGSELVYSQTMNDYRTHTGVDILTTDASTVVSAEAGKISNITDDALWGTTIEIEHENGFKTVYKNLSSELPEGVEIGSFVASGGIIGAVGSSALVEIGEDTHLHFEMSVNGNPVDPLEYIS